MAEHNNRGTIRFVTSPPSLPQTVAALPEENIRLWEHKQLGHHVAVQINHHCLQETNEQQSGLHHRENQTNQEQTFARPVLRLRRTVTHQQNVQLHGHHRGQQEGSRLHKKRKFQTTDQPRNAAKKPTETGPPFHPGETVPKEGRVPNSHRHLLLNNEDKGAEASGPLFPVAQTLPMLLETARTGPQPNLPPPESFRRGFGSPLEPLFTQSPLPSRKTPTYKRTS